MKAQNRKEIFLKALANGEEPNIKPLTREEELLAKQAKRESESTGGGTPHWNDIEGKPFGEVAGEVIIPETKVRFSGSGVNSECYIPASVNALYAGKDYVVSIESEAGKGSATVTCSEDAYLTCDVDFGLSRSFIIDFTEDGYRISSPYADGLELIISVQSGPSIQTIDPKYLPSGGGAFVVNFSMEDGQTVTADKTIDEVCEAVKNDMVVIANLLFGSDAEHKRVLSCFGGTVVGELTQIEFGNFQIHGNGSVQFMHLLYHATRGIVFSSQTYTPA